MREIQIEIRDADPAYVDQKVGAALYLHLRAVPANVELRRDALQRAHRRYEQTPLEDEDGRGALGLLVLQRTMLAGEDLGGLLYALEETPSFSRLLSYDLDAIGAIFRRLARDREALPGVYGFITPEAIETESSFGDEQRAALRRLRALTLSHVRRQLAEVLHFWDGLHSVAKKTMHGVGFVAGHHALGPPGAGNLRAYAPEAHPRPFALSLDTVIDHDTRHASTQVGVVDLSPPAVSRMAKAGAAACDATELLVGGRLHGLQTNHALTLPRRYVEELEPSDRESLAPLFDS